MKDIEELFLSAIEENSMFKPSERVVLGVSGGPDSVCLLNLFHKYNSRLKLNIISAHFNHSLRKEASDEEKFVRDVCANLGVRFVSEKKKVKDYFDGDSLEQTARRLRYDFFLSVCRRHKAKKLVLAHHLDDLVETVLLRIIRGSGLLGLRAIMPVSKFNKILVLRPLLAISKKDIINWLKRERVGYVIDKSNFDETFLRNNIRKNLLPLLEKLNPNVKEAIANLSATAGLDYDFLYSLAYKEYEQALISLRGRSAKLDLARLDKMHKALFFMILRISASQVKGNLRRLELKHLENVYALAKNNHKTGGIDLPDLRIEKTPEFLEIKFSL